jgi:hypothetical protein
MHITWRLNLAPSTVSADNSLKFGNISSIMLRNAPSIMRGEAVHATSG